MKKSKDEVIQMFRDIVSQKDADIVDFKVLGGMTNVNYFLKTSNQEYILRIPGVATDKLINRGEEKNNAQLVSSIGINPETIYFDEKSGVKLTEYLPDVITLSPTKAKEEHYISKTSRKIRELHNSNITFKNTFNVFTELNRYLTLIKNKENIYNLGYRDEVLNFFKECEQLLNKIGTKLVPCHNDLVAENIVDSRGNIYLIDWEYSGMNDPMWDLASHFLECDFSSDLESKFLHLYFESNVLETDQIKVVLYKFCQDLLWALWAIIKEEGGDNYGDYGIMRFKRAISNMQLYREKYAH